MPLLLLWVFMVWKIRFSEPCIVIHICKKDQQDVPLSLNNVFQLICPLHASKKQVHHQEVISVHAAYIISHVSLGV